MSKLYGTLSASVVEIQAANFGVAPPLLLGNLSAALVFLSVWQSRQRSQMSNLRDW